MKLAARTGLISSSPTLAITAAANRMKQQGIDVVGFGAGEPDFDTPEHIKEAAKKSMDAGFTKYTASSGIQELKEAICAKLQKDNGLSYQPGEIIVSCGAKHSLYNLILAVCGEGDEVILPVPYWVSYAEQVRLAGGKPVFVETSEESGFKLSAAQLEKALTGRTKVFILNSPSNPTGAVYTPEELEKLAAVVVGSGICCISDEIYEKIIYGARQASIASFGPEIKKLTVVVNGFSKSHSMTGWRIGYAAGDKEIIQAMSNIQDHSTSNPVSFCQKACVAALKEDRGDQEKMVSEFKKRRDYITERLNSIKGVKCLKPEGAFYVFPNVKGIIGKSYKGKSIPDSLELTKLLLEEAKIAVVPGTAFGLEGYLRLSYATSMKNIEKGMDRFGEFVKVIQ